MYISSSSSCDGAAHVLSTLVHAICTTFIIYSKQQLLRSYLSTQLRCELWVIASRYTYSHRFCKQTEQQYHSCQQLSRFLWDLHPYTHTPAPSRITILHLLAATSNGPPEGPPAKSTKSTETADTTTYQVVGELTNKRSVVITRAAAYDLYRGSYFSWSRWVF